MLSFRHQQRKNAWHCHGDNCFQAKADRLDYKSDHFINFALLYLEEDNFGNHVGSLAHRVHQV